MLLPHTESGAGPTLILLHSFGSGRGEWAECIERLASDRRCVALDLPGHGAARDISGYDVASMRDAVRQTIDALGVKRYVVVGHSMSGKVALALAAERPAGLAGVALVASSPPAPEPIDESNRVTMRAMRRTVADAEAFIDPITFRPLRDDARGDAVADFLACRPAAWDAWLTRGSEEDWSARVGALDLPALVITGANDPALPMAVQQRLTLPHVPHAITHDLPECGHLIPREQPDALARLLRDFAHANAS